MRYFIEISYKGTNYHGWQIQPEAISIQEEINKAISTILQEKVEVVGAGRTDSGVHAEQMFAHFDSSVSVDNNHLHKFNAILPDDIVLKKCFLVHNDAHARFDAIERSYEYRIYLGRNPFLLETTWQFYHQAPDVKKMNEAANILMDYTDFECFSKVKTDVKTFKCKISKAFWKQEGNHLIFCISADRFLRNMVRAIVGTLLEVGFEKIDLAQFKSIIESKKRSKAGASVPAKGLFLTGVKYNF